MRLLCFLAVLAALKVAQGQAGSPTLDGISGQMKDYLRGVTESRFEVRCKITSFDATGKVKRVRNDSHRLEFTQGRFRGAGLSPDSDWLSSIRITHASRATVGLQLFTDSDGLITPAFAFSRKTWTLEPSALSGGAAVVTYRSTGKCATFESAGNEFKYSRESCGAGQVVLDADGAVPLRTTFEALGLPLQHGNRSLVGYRVEADFQKLTVAGSQQMLILPKSATATFMFNDGKLTVESQYTLHSGKW